MKESQRSIVSPSSQLNPLQQEYFFMSNGIRKRKIFLNVDYSKEQLKWIKMVRLTLRKQKLFEIEDDGIILKIYYSSNLNMEKTIQKLKIYHNWFTNPQIQCMTEESRSILRQGFIYSYDKTSNGRPFIILNLSIVDVDRYQTYSYCQAINHVINRVVKQEFIPGRIEFYHFVIDLNEQLLSLPLTTLSKIIAELTEAYNSCLQKMMIVNCTVFSKWVFNRVTSFVSQETTRKIKLCTKQDLMEGQLTQFIDVDVLQKKYGGNKPNIDHSKLFRQQISDEFSDSTEYFSIEDKQPYNNEDSCCGNRQQCSIY